MNIGIIGAGNVGRALAGSSIRAGHAVTISAADPENALQIRNDWSWQSGWKLVGPAEPAA